MFAHFRVVWHVYIYIWNSPHRYSTNSKDSRATYHIVNLIHSWLLTTTFSIIILFEKSLALFWKHRFLSRATMKKFFEILQRKEWDKITCIWMLGVSCIERDMHDFISAIFLSKRHQSYRKTRHTCLFIFALVIH